MKPLNQRQVSRCEQATEPKCVCRCGGRLHGAKRAMGQSGYSRSFFEALPENDPHHLPSDNERRELAKVRREVVSLRKESIRWRQVWSEKDERELSEAERRLEQLERIVLGVGT